MFVVEAKLDDAEYSGSFWEFSVRRIFQNWVRWFQAGSDYCRYIFGLLNIWKEVGISVYFAQSTKKISLFVIINHMLSACHLKRVLRFHRGTWFSGLFRVFGTSSEFSGLRNFRDYLRVFGTTSGFSDFRIAGTTTRFSGLRRFSISLGFSEFSGLFHDVRDYIEILGIFPDFQDFRDYRADYFGIFAIHGTISVLSDLYKRFRDFFAIFGPTSEISELFRGCGTAFRFSGLFRDFQKYILSMICFAEPRWSDLRLLEKNWVEMSWVKLKWVNMNWGVSWGAFFYVSI